VISARLRCPRLYLLGIPAVIWGNVRGYGKEQQRGLSVPFNFLMLLATVAITGIKGDFHDPVTQAQLLVAVPVALMGWSVGVRCFGRISEAGFRRFVMLMLFLSGLALVVPSAKSLTRCESAARQCQADRDERSLTFSRSPCSDPLDTGIDRCLAYLLTN
jgi:hypothetical protein